MCAEWRGKNRFLDSGAEAGDCLLRAHRCWLPDTHQLRGREGHSVLVLIGVGGDGGRDRGGFGARGCGYLQSSSASLSRAAHTVEAAVAAAG